MFIRTRQLVVLTLVACLVVVDVISAEGGRPEKPTLPSPPEKPSRMVLCRSLLRSLDNLDGRARDKFLNYLHRRFKPCFAIAQVTGGLISQGSDTLIDLTETDLISQEILSTFPPEAIEQAQQQGEQAEGQVRDITLVGDPDVFGDWMEVNLRVATEQSIKDYLAVFHLEDGDWKLFGTQLLE